MRHRSERVRRSLRVLVAGAVLVSACGGGSGSGPGETAVVAAPTDAIADAGDVVIALIEALSGGRFDDTAGLVDERQLALLTFLDGTAPGEVAAMLDGGVPAAVRAAFWSTFSTAVTEISGEPVGRLEIEGQRELLDGFVAISTVIGATERSSEWVVRVTDDGWRIDLLATFGGVFAPNLWAWSETLVEGDSRTTVFQAIADQHESLAVARTLGQARLPDEAIDALVLLENR